MSAKPFLRSLLALGAVLTLSACESWVTDMRQQPSVGTWQRTVMDTAQKVWPWDRAQVDSMAERVPSRGNPIGSVPTTGTVVADWEVSHSQLPTTVDSLSGLRNPVAADNRSITNGHRLYQVNCAVCHGDLGDGQGSVGKVSGIPFVPSIIVDQSKARTDGYLWGMMRNGRGLMASYNRISERERWDVVNYVRGLQGRYAVPTGATTYPGSPAAYLPPRVGGQ